MKSDLIERVDNLIEEYKKQHKGEPPYYILMSPDDADLLTEEVRRLNDQPKGDIITTYKDYKIVRNMSIGDSEFYVSNDLPETGS